MPDGSLHAIRGRGTVTGNRGILHVADGKMGSALWKHRAWICCTLDWQGRRRRVMSGRKWTELFFLDEAVAMAAGHRPCGYCRREAFDRFKAAWARAFGDWPGVKAVDAELHAARAIPGARNLRSHVGVASGLPTGAMIRHRQTDWLIRDGQALPFDWAGYAEARALPTGEVTILTNQVTLAVLRAGFRPILHPSAQGRG